MQTPLRCSLEGKRRETMRLQRENSRTLKAAVDKAYNPVVEYGGLTGMFAVNTVISEGFVFP